MNIFKQHLYYQANPNAPKRLKISAALVGLNKVATFLANRLRLVLALSPSAKTRSYSEIDPKVKPLVEKMNATGLIRTIASCQGHGAFGKPPYIYFKASAKTAAAIEYLLRNQAMLDNLMLQKMWIIQGQFDENFELTFLLHSPEYNEKSYSLLNPLFFGLFRKQLDTELLLLCRVIDQAMLLKIWNKNKPCITTRCNYQHKAD